MNRHGQPDHTSNRRPATPNLGDLPVVRARPSTTDEDWELEQDLEDEPELAAYYRDLAEVNEVIVEAHRLLTEPTTDQ